MTKRATGQEWQTGGLKAIVLTGSVVATLAGARLLALQEQVAAAQPDAGQVLVPVGNIASMPPASLGVELNLSPIPQVVQPRLNPIARSRSSR